MLMSSQTVAISFLNHMIESHSLTFMGSHSMAEVQKNETIFLSNLVQTKLCRSFTGAVPPDQAEIVRIPDK